ncbi:MAG: TolC family protein [Chthoniobacteraceae bacterium]|jgi:outer membrane protein TolC
MSLHRPKDDLGRKSRLVCGCLWAISLGLAGITQTRGRDLAPPSSDQPWSPAQLSKYEQDLAAQASQYRQDSTRVEIEPGKVYDLPELIDIAQRNNPQTRIAWERARQAAAAVGLSESAYYPYLVASAGAGYARAFLPFPSLAVDQGPLVQELVRASANPEAALQALEKENPNVALPPVSITGGGTVVIDSVASNETLSVKWLLIDFGERGAIVDAARQQLMMANVGFNATHQKIVFEVTRNFYDFGNAREQVAVAESALRAAQTVEQAVKARLDNGLAIKPELLQAQQQTAQLEFELEAALGAESDAQVALVDSLGILPTTQLQVADFADKPLPPIPEESVDELIDLALSQRPDLVMELANLRAKQAGVRAARADFYPKIAVGADVGDATLNTSVADSAYFGGQHSVYGADVTVELPIFDGFERLQKLRIAEADLRSAESELADARDSAVREVWKAYTDFRTALREEDVATKLLAAAENASSAVLESYKNGLSTYPEVVNAERDVTSAQNVGHNTRAAIFTSAAALALSIGELAKPAPAPSRN